MCTPEGERQVVSMMGNGYDQDLVVHLLAGGGQRTSTCSSVCLLSWDPWKSMRWIRDGGILSLLHSDGCTAVQSLKVEQGIRQSSKAGKYLDHSRLSGRLHAVSCVFDARNTAAISSCEYKRHVIVAVPPQVLAQRARVHPCVGSALRLKYQWGGPRDSQPGKYNRRLSVLMQRATRVPPLVMQLE